MHIPRPDGVRILLGGYCLLSALAAAPARARPGLELAPQPGEAVAGPTPVTFGVTFRPGEMPAGKTVKARLGGPAVVAQLDAKRRHEDGSLKHGIVSLIVPKLEAPAALELSPVEAAAGKRAVGEMARKLLAGDFEATVRFTFPDGKTATASARKMLQAAGAEALGAMGEEESIPALEAALSVEPFPWVREKITQALNKLR